MRFLLHFHRVVAGFQRTGPGAASLHLTIHPNFSIFGGIQSHHGKVRIERHFLLDGIVVGNAQLTHIRFVHRLDDTQLIITALQGLRHERNLPHTFVVQIHIRALLVFGSRQLHPTEIRLQRHVHHRFSLGSHLNHTGLGMIIGTRNTIIVFAVAHTFLSISIFADTQNFIAKFYHRIGRLYVEDDILLIHRMLHNSLHLSGRKNHFVSTSLGNGNGEIIVAQNAQLRMLDGDTLDAVRHIHPHFANILFHTHNTGHTTVEEEASFVGYDFNQGSNFAVLVFFHRAISIGRQIVFQGTERSHTDTLRQHPLGAHKKYEK